MYKFIQIIFFGTVYFLAFQNISLAQDYDKIVLERQKNMKIINKTVKSITKELRSDANKNNLAQLSNNLEIAIRETNKLFQINTSSSKEDTDALDKIWQADSSFKQYFNKFEESAFDLKQSLSSNNIDDFKDRFKDLTRSCKSCHRLYKD